ncbi:hypothetical protein F4779DRAFT_593482 [Xylariaceae sp. FL0662B]|nr:hypothetical protein F4779DRAFT_593482 [Xylariaceae sp. FL0662B]
MPLPGSATRNLCVYDVLAFNSAELVQYIKQNRRLDGSFDLELDGWETLPKAQRAGLAEKLRIETQKVNDALQSCPIDAAQLHRVADHEDALPQALSERSRDDRSPTVEVDWDAEGKRRETIAYNNLVSDGGHPAYPINLIEKISKNPKKYYKMLHPWQDSPNTSPPDWTGVFWTQLQRWQMFRRWQRDNREPYNEEKEFAAYVEEQKRQDAEGTEYRPTPSQYLENLRASFKRKQHYYFLDDGDEWFAAYVEEKKQEEYEAGRQWPGITEGEYAQMLINEFLKKQIREGIDDGDEGFAAFVEEEKQKNMAFGCGWPGMTEDEYLQMHRKSFEREQKRHYWLEFYWLREDHGRGGFSGYVEEAKRRLARHGFTRTFQLDKDPMRQDKLTTWIEYLNYEYSWLDQHTRLLARLQPDYEKYCRKLVKSGVLCVGETAAEIYDMDSEIRRQNQEDAAEEVKRVKTATIAILQKAMDNPQYNFAESVCLQTTLKEAGFNLEAAKASLRKVRRRGNLISEFVRGVSDYRTVEIDISLQRIRTRWIRKQVPLIEAEARNAKAAEDIPRISRGTKRRMKEDQDDKHIEDRSLKRKNQSHQAGSHSEDLDPSTQAKASKRRRLAEAIV